MAVRMVRTKVLAVLLGPAGVGLEAIFDAVLTFTRTLFDLGLSSSGVRQIAASQATGDPQRIAATVFTLRRTCLILGSLSALVLFLAREPVSKAAFGHTEHATALGWLAVVLLCGGIAGGQSALLQGMRRIGDLARMNIIGTVVGAVVSIPIVMVWGQAGIPAYMIAAAVVALLSSWYYARRIVVERVTLPFSALATEVKGLLSLGVAFMLSGLIVAGAAFLIRAMVTRQYGMDGAGQFQAASALSLVYIGFILQAMGTDFYPRLTAVAHDDEKCNTVINEQAEVSLMLALPGILGTLALAPWVIRIFYSGQFAAATDILVWQMLGMLLRVMSWPLGFMVMAKGKGGIFIATEVAAFSSYLVLAWLGMQWFGLTGTGIAFFGMYVFYVLMMTWIARKLSGFRWSAHYLRYAAIGMIAAVVVLYVRLEWPEPWATILPCVFAAGASLCSLRYLFDIIGSERIRKLVVKLGGGRFLKSA
jgi:antigen flippase